MLKFDEEQKLQSVRGALSLRGEIETFVDAAWDEGIRRLYWLGIGGTWASAKQVTCHMKERTALETFALNAAEYAVVGDRRIGEGTLVVFSSVSGTTSEVVAAVEKVKQAGAMVLGFVDDADAPLARLADHCISYPGNEQLKFFMTADCFLYRAGELPEYEEMYARFERFLPEALVSVEKAADPFAAAFAVAHKDDPLHYFVGAGTLWGAAYSYAMCFWEEMHWMRSKSIHAAELFHGTLEVIGEDTPVTLFIGEDTQRPLGERAARFLSKVNRNHTVIDTKDYELPGIEPVFRGAVSHLVMRAVTGRIDVHLEALSGHDMSLRRYYRKMDY